MNKLFTIIFQDDSLFEGGDNISNTKWKEIPDKSIRTIFYRLPLGDYLCLSDFSRIYHYIEAIEDLNGKKQGQVIVESSNLIIERNNQYFKYNIDYKNFGIKVEILTEDNEFIKKLNPKFWKKGGK